MKNSETYFIGIDPSLTNTWIVLVDDHWKVVESRSIHTKSSEPINERLWVINKEVTRVLSIRVGSISFKIWWLYIEEPVIGRGGGRQIMVMLQAVWSIKAAIWSIYGTGYETVNVSTAKKFMGIKRWKTKADIRKHVQRIVYGREYTGREIKKLPEMLQNKILKNDHECDAYTIVNAKKLFYDFTQ